MRTVMALVLTATAVAACSRIDSTRGGLLGDDGGTPPDFSPATPPDDLAPAVTPDDLTEDTTGTDDAYIDPCLERAKLIYTIDQDNSLRSFRPDKLTFTPIGMVNCPSQFGATPFSMSVDRNALAWVLYSSGEVFQVDTATAICAATTYMTGQNGFQRFGMGFVADQPGSRNEHIYLAGLENGQLGVMDPKTLLVSGIGALKGQPELTGTATAHLWAFFPDLNMPRVTELDKTTAQEGMTYGLNALAGTASSWAFAFWGGDFWIFLRRSVDNSTHVYHLEAKGGKVSDVVPNTGFNIVGAGVSICAPTTAPH